MWILSSPAPFSVLACEPEGQGLDVSAGGRSAGLTAHGPGGCCRCASGVSGPQHPHTLLARANLAFFTGQAGDAAGARDLYAGLLPVIERVLGPGHADTLTVRANLLTSWSKRAAVAMSL